MKIKNILILIFASIVSIKNIEAQCDVKKKTLQDSSNHYFMAEPFYNNKDFENGWQSIFIIMNRIVDTTKKQIHENWTLVTSYSWGGYKKEMTPNKLIIKLSNDSIITLIAENKSRNTVNGFPAENVRSIECSFTLNKDQVNMIQSTKTVKSIYLYDYKDNTFIDLSEKYKGQLAEMITCLKNKT